jgi:multiple sugar transport system substrate-binding protein
MRKSLYILTALVMVMSMVLAACAPSATPVPTAVPTEAVAVDATATTEAAPADATATTAAPADAATATATVAAATATLTPYPVASCEGGKVCVRWFVGLGTGTDPAQITTQEEVVKDFNASQSKIQLILEIVPFAAAKDALSTEIAADNGPDIVGPVGWGGSNAYYDQWADIGPLMTKAKFDTSIFDPALVKFYQVEGKQVGLPFAVYPGAIYFIPAMFDESGLAYPPQTYGQKYKMPDGKMVDWNWDTVTQVAKLLTIDKNGKNSTEDGFDKTQIVQIGYSAQWQSPLSVATFYAGAQKIYEGDKTGNYKSAIPTSWQDAWKWYYDGMWGKQPYIANGALAGSPEFGAGNTFNSGKAAMGLTQTWYTCCLADFAKAGNQFQLGIQPMGSDGKVHGRVDADTFRMWKGSKHLDESFTVLAYLITTGGDKLLPAYGAMPAIASKTQAFFDKKAKDYPFVTKESWNVFVEGLGYPDTPSSEQFQPHWNEATAREQTFFDLMGNTAPDKFDFAAEFKKMVDDVNVIYNK